MSARRFLCHLVGLSVALLAPARGAAQQARGPSLTVLDAVERALERYPSIRSAEAGRVEAAAGLREVETTRRPRLNLRATANQYQKKTVVSPIHGFTPGGTPPFDQTLFQTAVDGSYTLFDGGGREARIDQARFQAEAAGTAIEGVRDRVTARVVTSYARILSQRQILDAHDRRIAALQAEQERVGQLLEVGRAARLEALRVSASLADATANRVRFAEALDIAERELARLIDATRDETRAARLVPFELPAEGTPDQTRLLETVRQTSPSIQEARRRVAVAEAAIAVAESERLPRFDLVGSFIDFGSAAGHFTNEWSGGVQVRYPLFDGGAVRERVARTAAARDVAVERLRLLETESAGELDRALSAVSEAAARRASLIPAAEQFEEVARIEQLRLDTGTGTQTDFLAAEADLLAVRASLVDARYAELAARIEVARVTGELGPEWLRRQVKVSP